mmetsp:Transcript_1102/g.1533  ORF Transcript_1102/g.1533 Transcript_1102/m.1533 type:complete len:156 (+) Transcript_1102:35-502(+)
MLFELCNLISLCFALEGMSEAQSCETNGFPLDVDAVKCLPDVRGKAVNKPWWHWQKLGALMASLVACLVFFFTYRRCVSPSRDEETPLVRKPDLASLPLLMYISQKALQKANQGLEWTSKRLREDEDGDSAHDFLGPFSFSSADNKTRNLDREKL